MSGEVSKEILRAILKALEQKFNLIGSIVEGEAREKILQDDIKDKGDFYKNTGYEVVIGNDAITLL